MSEIPDLSKYKGDPANDGAVDDGKVHLTDEERETLAAMATADDKNEAPPAPPAVEVATAYVVAIYLDGSVRVLPYEGASLSLQRPFGNVDLIGSAAFVQADMETNLAAVKVQQAIAMLGAQAAEAQARAQVQQQLSRGPRGGAGLGFPPGR